MQKSTGVIVGLLVCFALLAGGVFLVSGSQALGTAEFSVAKMTCGSCASKITAALDQVPGVGPVGVDVARGTVTVAFAEDRVSVYRLAKVISSTGFPAQLRQVWLAAEGEGAGSLPQSSAADRSGGCGGGCCGGS